MNETIPDYAYRPVRSGAGTGHGAEDDDDGDQRSWWRPPLGAGRGMGAI